MAENAPLLPCPFCGGQMHEIGTGNIGYSITCHSFSCRASTGIWPTENEAIAAWNRRADIHATLVEASAEWLAAEDTWDGDFADDDRINRAKEGVRSILSTLKAEGAEA